MRSISVGSSLRNGRRPKLAYSSGVFFQTIDLFFTTGGSSKFVHLQNWSQIKQLFFLAQKNMQKVWGPQPIAAILDIDAQLFDQSLLFLCELREVLRSRGGDVLGVVVHVDLGSEPR